MNESTPAGQLPEWEETDLPAPPALNFRNKLRMAGPGAILLAASIGGGEWLVGPAATVQYGTAILGVVTIAIALQLVFNLEAIRYTLYTGEPIYGGFLRLKPGPRFWTPFYFLLSLVHLGWPALAAAAASTVLASATGRLPADADATSLAHAYSRPMPTLLCPDQCQNLGCRTKGEMSKVQRFVSTARR